MFRSERIVLATLLGVIVFLSKFFVPTPIDKMLIFIEAALLGLSSLLIGRFGATYTGLINGLLLTVWRSTYAPFSLIFAVAYGLMIDIFFHIFRVKVKDEVKRERAIVASILSTLLVGIPSMYVTYLIGLLPMIPVLYAVVILAGIPSGILAGYIISFIFNKYLARIRTKT